MFDGDTYNNTGVYGATDNKVYRYSYYFDEWFPLENNGLPIISGEVNIIDLAVADTGTSYTSGIYIIADTAVFNYNWYTQEWYPLSNEGLNRIGGVVKLSKISVFGKGSSTDHRIFCVSDTSVFVYEWYYPKWFAFYNTGLSVMRESQIQNTAFINAYPNPFNEKTNIELKLNKRYTGRVKIAIYDSKGVFVSYDNFEVIESEIIEYPLNKDFKKGTYFCEIVAGRTKSILTLIAN